MVISPKARPRKKPAYPSVKVGNEFYIAGFGSVTKYDDERGMIGRLVELLDGTRTAAEISAVMIQQYPDLTDDMVYEALADMDKDGFLEDVVLTGSDTLSSYALQRYHRNINFLSTYASLEQNKYELQKKLLDAKVCLLGLGGLGSHIAYDLAGLGIGHIRAIEFDKVELSNLNRQILYNDLDIGKSKAQLAASRISAFNPSIKFEVVEKQLASADDVCEVAEGFDYLILVADRPKTLIARWANEAAVRSGATLLAGGLEAQRALHYTVIPGVTGCIECWLSHVKEADPVSFQILEERRRLNITGDNTAIVPLVSVVTGLINAELVRLITGIRPSVAAGKLVTIDFDTMTTTVREHWSRDPNCPVCKGVVR